MTEAIAADPILQTDFVKEMARQMRALDTYGTYQGWSVEKILDPYVLTKERKANIPLIGDPDDETISRVKAFYNAIAVLIEKECKLLAVPLVHLTHEGFGQRTRFSASPLSASARIRPSPACKGWEAR